MSVNVTLRIIEMNFNYTLIDNWYEYRTNNYATAGDHGSMVLIDNQYILLPIIFL